MNVQSPALDARRILALVALAVAPTGCGDDTSVATPDAGTPETYRLEVLDPPGESLGLRFAGTQSLRVRYADSAGEPVPDARVGFQFVTSGVESTGGSALSAEQALTDEQGVAEVQLAAGAERASFRVQASAPSASPVFFYAAVAEGGFTNLEITPRHLGDRDPDDFASVQLRLYREVELACGQLDIDDRPQSLFPPRSLTTFGRVGRWANLVAGEGHTVVAWAPGPSGVPLASGCIDLGPDLVDPERTVATDLPVADIPLTLGEGLGLLSTFDLRPLRDSLPGSQLWKALRCPLGPAQVLIDCAVDFQAPDGTFDCIPQSSDELVGEVNSARGTPTGLCRPATLDGGGESLDALVDAALTDDWRQGGSSHAIANRRRQILGFAEVDSQLLPRTAGVVRHRLLEARLTTVTGTFIEDLVASSRPVIAAEPVPVTLTGAGALSIGEHGFTFDLDMLLIDAFVALALQPASLEGRESDLASALSESLTSGLDTGCDALDTIVCSSAGCLDQCPSMLPQLDAALAAWTLHLQATGLDLLLTGAGLASDMDGDRIVDTVSSAASSWTAELHTLDAPEILPATISSGEVQ